MALRILSGVGSVIRQAGRAVDSFGASLQGRYAYRESCAPSLLLSVTCMFDDTQLAQLASPRPKQSPLALSRALWCIRSGCTPDAAGVQWEAAHAGA